MNDQPVDTGFAVAGQIRDAIERHDLDALVDVFDPDVLSETPAHLQRTFRGAEQVRRNWEQIFAAVPDLQADLLDVVARGETVWSEWDWRGTRRDGSSHRMRGVTIIRIDKARAISVHFYVQPVDEAGPGADEAVRQIVRSVEATGTAALR